MLKQIIINELNKRLGRNTTPAETHDAVLYVTDLVEEDTTMLDLTHIMDDYMADTYVRCDQCGEMHRRDDMTDISGPYGCMWVCAKSDCEIPAYDAVHYNSEREWATY